MLRSKNTKARLYNEHGSVVRSYQPEDARRAARRHSDRRTAAPQAKKCRICSTGSQLEIIDEGRTGTALHPMGRSVPRTPSQAQPNLTSIIQGPRWPYLGPGGFDDPPTARLSVPGMIRMTTRRERLVRAAIAESGPPTAGRVRRRRNHHGRGRVLRRHHRHRSHLHRRRSDVPSAWLR